jgi:hypothetical protein
LAIRPQGQVISASGSLAAHVASPFTLTTTGQGRTTCRGRRLSLLPSSNSTATYFDSRATMPDDHRVAKTIITQVTDDIDGSKNAETVSFSLGGAQYTIDLSSKNRAKLEAALKPYIEAATKVPRRSRRGASTPRSRRSVADLDVVAVRAWAVENGYQISNRGRVPKAVLEAYAAR